MLRTCAWFLAFTLHVLVVLFALLGWCASIETVWVFHLVSVLIIISMQVSRNNQCILTELEAWVYGHEDTPLQITCCIRRISGETLEEDRIFYFGQGLVLFLGGVSLGRIIQQ